MIWEDGSSIGEKFGEYIGRLEQQARTLGFDEISHPLAYICTEVVEDDNLPRTQCRRREPPHVRLEKTISSVAPSMVIA